MTSNCKRHHRLLQGLLIGLLSMASWIVQAAPNAYYIHNDHRGAPIVMTNANKTVVWQVAYKPYGEVVPIVSSADLDIRYPGQRQDDGTGLYYNHYRDYDPALGRYVQSDPIGLEGGINTYAYALGNPIMNIDPLGLAPPIGPGGVRSPLNCTEGFCPTGPGGWAGKVGGITKQCPEILEPYKRPSYATTKAQRESVQGRACVDCGVTTPKQVADHKKPLVEEYYETGGIDKSNMRNIDAVQPQCPTCSSKQGAAMSQFSKKIKKDLGL